MPRIRTIKPEFWSSPDVAGMSPWARLLYIAMWNWADDCGRGTANPKELAAFAFPHDPEVGASELPRILAEVADGFGVIFYRVHGRPYYAIPSWDRHQRRERRAGSRHPGPDEGEHFHPMPPDQQQPPQESESGGTSAQKRGNTGGTHGSSGPGTGEQGNRGNGTLTGSADPADGSTGGAVVVHTPADNINKTAQECAKIYYDGVNGMAKFPAVLSIAKKALKNGYSSDTVGQAMQRLASEGRSVTVDALRYEMDGFPQPRNNRPAMESRITNLQALKSVPGGAA